MKIYRKPHSAPDFGWWTGTKWKQTDSQSPSDYTSCWKPGEIIKFSGTIDKSGGEHTDFGVEIDEDDIGSLCAVLVAEIKE